MRHASAIAWIVLAGCAQLDDFSRVDSCGNRVLEPDEGEDCDTFASEAGAVCGNPGSANACRYLCSDAKCPTGWGCGDDGICRLGSGTFADPIAVHSIGRIAHLELADLDGDGLPDELASTGRDIHVSFATREGRNDETLVSLDDIAQDFLAYDFDGEDGAELAIALAAGDVVILHERDRAMVSAASALDGPLLQHDARDYTFGYTVPYITGIYSEQETILVDASDTALSLSFPFVSQTVTRFDLPAFAAPNFPPAVAHADLDLGRVRDGDITTGEELLIARSEDRIAIVAHARCGAPPPDKLCTYDEVARIELPVSLSPRSQPLAFADVNDDGELDALFQLGSAGLEYAVAFGDGLGGFCESATVASDRCTENRAAFDSRFERAALAGCGLSTSLSAGPIGTGDFDGDGVSDFIISGRVFFGAAGGRDELRPGPCAYGAIAIADYDDDDRDDVAFISSDFTITVIRGARDRALGSFRIPTAQRATRLDSADFDGDGYDDLAFLDASNTFWIAFGAPGALLDEPVLIADLGEQMIFLASGNMISSSGRPLRFEDLDELDLAADAMFLTASGAVHVLRGLPGRRMLPVSKSTFARADLPIMIAAGAFTSSIARELVTIDRAGNRARWSGGLIGSSQTIACIADLNCQHVETADLDGDARDDLVFAPCTTSDRSTMVAAVYEDGRCETIPVEVAPGWSMMRAIAADLDGEGFDDDLLVELWGPGGIFLETRHRALFRARDGGFEDPIEIDRRGTGRDFTTVEVRSDRGRIVALSQLYEVELFDLEGDAAVRAGSLSLQRAPADLAQGLYPENLTAKDVDRDGLEDLVFVLRNEAWIARQLPARPK